MNNILGHHHVTLCVGKAQEDYDFHTKVLGLKSVKKTLLFDGKIPIYHLYYGNETGDPSTLITCFPMDHVKAEGKRGSGQIKTILCSVPYDSINFWQSRLKDYGIENRIYERFGEKRIKLTHPCGIGYEMVGVEKDTRKPYINGDMGEANAIRGVYGITVSVREQAQQSKFMKDGIGFNNTGEEENHTRYEVSDGGPGRVVEFLEEPDLEQGSWVFAAGTVHHCAFGVNDAEEQAIVKNRLEGIGYTDCSDVKDRKYFHSVYFRTPGGALFEATYNSEKGFQTDEALADFGKDIQVSPQFEQDKDELIAQLEPLNY